MNSVILLWGVTVCLETFRGEISTLSWEMSQEPPRIRLFLFLGREGLSGHIFRSLPAISSSLSREMYAESPRNQLFLRLGFEGLSGDISREKVGAQPGNVSGASPNSVIPLHGA